MELLFLGKIFAVFLVLGILFIVVDRMNQKGYYNRMKAFLEQEWGCPTREEYTEKILQNISYYASQTGTEQDIDDITWNDPKRSEGWTPEMREKARQRAKAHYKKEGADE